METKELDVTIDGKISTIKYKTSLTYGEQTRILGKTFDNSNPLQPKFDAQLYQRMIWEAVITDAPFNPKDWTTIMNYDADIVDTIMEALMKQFPLERLFKANRAMLTPAIQQQTDT